MWVNSPKWRHNNLHTVEGRISVLNIPVPVGQCHHNVKWSQEESDVKETVVICHGCFFIIIHTLDPRLVFFIRSIPTLSIYCKGTRWQGVIYARQNGKKIIPASPSNAILWWSVNNLLRQKYVYHIVLSKVRQSFRLKQSQVF